MGFNTPAAVTAQAQLARRCLERIHKGEAPMRIRWWLDRQGGKKYEDASRDRVLTMYATLLYGELDLHVKGQVVADRLLRSLKPRKAK